MKVTVSQTLSKTFDIEVLEGETLEEAFRKQHWDVASLLGVLESCLEEKLDHYAEYSVPDDDPGVKITTRQYLSCRGWTTDEFEVIKEHEIS